MIKRTLKGNVLSLDKGYIIHPFPPVNHSWDVPKVPRASAAFADTCTLKAVACVSKKTKLVAFLLADDNFICAKKQQNM